EKPAAAAYAVADMRAVLGAREVREAIATAIEYGERRRHRGAGAVDEHAEDRPVGDHEEVDVVHRIVRRVGATHRGARVQGHDRSTQPRELSGSWLSSSQEGTGNGQASLQEGGKTSIQHKLNPFRAEIRSGLVCPIGRSQATH